MTDDQKTFRNYLLAVFDDQCQDIIRSLVWISNHVQKLPRNVHVAYRRLSTSERNAVIREVLLNGD